MEAEIRRKILDIVHARPRAIAEIALEIKKNWRTADRYVDTLVEEDLLKIHVFRKGGRGSLKIAYWPTSITETPSAVKNFLLTNIMNAKRKENFSPLDILQHVNKSQRKASHLSPEFYHSGGNVESFFNSLKSAEKRILFFSGNLTFTKMGGRYQDQLDLIEKKVKEGVEILILSRVDVTNKEVVSDLLEINKKGYKGRIEIRYAFQPLRCTVIDERLFYIKESFFSQYAGYKEDGEWSWEKGEYIYTITDKEWVDWMIDVFWHIWRGSVDAKLRLDVLDYIIEKQ